jgi:hypothetical protein
MNAVIEQLFNSGTSNSNARAVIDDLSSEQSAIAQSVADSILADPAATPDARLAAERVRRLLLEEAVNERVNSANELYVRAATLAEGDTTVTLSLSPLEWALLAIVAILLILFITFLVLYLQQRNSTLRKVGKRQLDQWIPPSSSSAAPYQSAAAMRAQQFQ